MGVVESEAVTVTGTATATFSDENVGTGKPVTVIGYGLTGADAGNYSLSQPSGLTANITAKGLTISGVTADSKTYDGDSAAALSGVLSLNGLVGGDSVSLGGTPSATFDNKNIGTAKAVTVVGYSLIGPDAGNYGLSQPTGLTANIIAKGLTIADLTVDNKTYDGNTTAVLSGTPALVGVVDTEDVTLGGTASAAFNNKNIGTAKPVTVLGYTLGGTAAGNYTLLSRPV